jgi:hypothetical protein
MALRSATGGTILMSTHKQATVNTVLVDEHYFMIFFMTRTTVSHHFDIDELTV